MTATLTEQEKKPSLKEKIGKGLSKLLNVKIEKTQEYKTGTLPDQGFTVVSDGKYEARMQLTEALLSYIITPIKLSDDLSQIINEIELKLNRIHLGIHVVSAPFATAKDDPLYTKKLHGWDGMHGFVSGIIIESKVYYTGENQEFELTSKESVKNLYLTVVKHVFTQAYDLVAYCYGRLDVRPSSVTVIQNFMPNKGQVPTGYESGLRP